MPQPIKQKIEISKRITLFDKDQCQLRLLSSPVTNTEVLLYVASPELIWNAIISALKERREPRDLFDIWYLSEKLKKDIPTDIPKFSKRVLKLKLNKYLPKNYEKIISVLEKL